MAAPWPKNEDDAMMDGERLKGEVVEMDWDYEEKLEMKEHVAVPMRVYLTHEDLEVFGFTAKCPKFLSLLKVTARHAPTETVERRMQE